MARVDLTDYELAHDRLPAVCAKCGMPTTERSRMTQTLYFIDGWWGAAQVVAVVVGVFFFPPLAVGVIRSSPVIRVAVPLCPAHRDLFRARERQERRWLFPVWTAAAVVMDVMLVVEFVVGGPGVSCCGLVAVLIAAVTASAVIARGRVGLAKPRKTGVRLTGVHPAFAAALLEDRARDRIDNPDRRGGHGDVRDDFDDEPG